jgi:hypothetical protein
MQKREPVEGKVLRIQWRDGSKVLGGNTGISATIFDDEKEKRP